MNFTEEQILNLVEKSSNGIIITDNKHRVVYANKQNYVNLGENIQDKYISDFIDAKLIESAQDKSFFVEHIKIKNTSYLFEATKLNANYYAYIISAFAKFEEKIDELDLMNKMQMVQVIINSSYDGIYITDGEGNTKMINKSYERLTGIRQEEVIGHNMKTLVEKKYFSQSASLEAIKNRKTVSVRQKIKSGKEVLATAMPVFKDKKIIYVVTNVRDISELIDLQEEALFAQELNEKYKSEIDIIKKKNSASGDLIFKNAKMLDVLEMAIRAAKFDSTVLLLGNTGVGKGEIAHLIHGNSLRKDEKFIEVNCGAIPANLLESELFGYAKGAFTGALSKGKQGFFGIADKGTIFLDEISEMPIETQVKLLHVIQEKTITKIGDLIPQKLDIRIIAASNKDLLELVEKGLFREDLYYRLSVIPIYIASLKDRKEDIIPLALKFLKEFNKKFTNKKQIKTNCLNALEYYNWPGNVRELRNMIERLVIMTNKNLITLEDLPNYVLAHNDSENNIEAYQGMELKSASKLFEKKLIQKTIESCGSVKKAAKILNIDQSTISRKLSK